MSGKDFRDSHWTISRRFVLHWDRKPTECEHIRKVSSPFTNLEISRFRWVDCQLNTISECAIWQAIRHTLNSLPADLGETYKRILLAVNPVNYPIARRALMWLVTALAPLTLSQLVEALKTEHDKFTLNDDLSVIDDTDIVKICGSLVTFDEKTGIISLSHFTVKVKPFYET